MPPSTTPAATLYNFSRRNALATGFLLAAFLSPANAQDLSLEQRENALALYAKLLCSGVFVIERDPDEFIRSDLADHNELMPGWDNITVDIDRERKRVTLRLEGVPPRTAAYYGDQGCTLLPKGLEDVFFDPVAVPRNLPDPKTTPWPMGEIVPDADRPWIEVDAMENILDYAFDDARHEVPQKTRAIVVVYNGQIVAERYAPGFTPDTRHITWSMGKSITAALTGLLIRDGHFTVDDPAPIAAWHGENDPRSNITVADLLHMSGGLQFNTGASPETIYTTADNHRYVYFAAPHVFDYSIHNPLQYPPGNVWRYRNCDPLALGKIIRETVEARGENYLQWPQRALFDKLGMRNMVLECDPWGNFIMTGFDYGTARDWARFGLLFLNNGAWQGEQLLPESFVEFVRTPAPAHDTQGYGGLFWLNAGGDLPDVPQDTFWPAGHHGQVCLIIPSRDTVIVRLGHSARGGFDAYLNILAANILAAIPNPE